jgi:hypothetical protein
LVSDETTEVLLPVSAREILAVIIVESSLDLETIGTTGTIETSGAGVI